MNRVLTMIGLIGIVCTLAGCAQARVLPKSVLDTAAAPSRHYVFAHYMVSNRDYGGTVAGYEQDIRDAQSAGVDGFVLNIGWWGGANYKKDTASMFQAAHALGTGFKLFFSVDEGQSNLTTQGIPASDILNMMQTYGNDPCYFHYLGRPVLSTYGGDGPSIAVARDFWLNQVLTPLRSSGCNVFFVPQFSAKYYTSTWSALYRDPSAQKISDSYQNLWKDLVDGLFQHSLESPTYPSTGSLLTEEAYAALCHQNGKIFMSSVSPQYWGSIQKRGGRAYNEFQGGEGLGIQWNSIINIQKADWVELFTWNDFDESTYFSPIDDVLKYWPYLIGHRTPGFYKSHAGALALTKYYIQWFKTGIPPATTSDHLYVFYRTQALGMVAASDARGPVSSRNGSPQNMIYITTRLTKPATLEVTTGTQTVTRLVPAGVSSLRVPFHAGAPTFRLVRKGKTVLSQEGEPIVKAADDYNFNYYTKAAAN